MHKMVNGVKIELSHEEEEKIKQEWALNEQKEIAQRREFLEKEQKKKACLEKIKSVVNLSDEEIEVQLQKNKDINDKFLSKEVETRDIDGN